MKTVLRISVLAFLIAGLPNRCFAMMDIEQVTQERAKELGIEIHAKAAGPSLIRVGLEFEPKGTLKDFSRVDLIMTDGGKLLVHASLREEASKPGHIVVGIAVDRADLDKLTLRVVVSDGLGGSGYDLHVKDFVDLAKVR